ncbi:MAG: hypothetical protein ABNH00_11155 [Dokdonia sp.]|jgi:hypothetical protein|nr:hypothetical protein [Cytophagaceae bacterium]
MLRFKQGEIPGYAFAKALKKPIPIRCYQIDEPFEVETMEGVMKAKKGDWLMIGVSGEMYACDRLIFEQTYEIIQPT